MLNRLKFFFFFLMVILTLACTHKPKVTEPKKEIVAAAATEPKVNLALNDHAAFIAGLPNGKNDCLSRLDSSAEWIHYCKKLDSLFSHTNSFRINKMKVWADSELIKNQKINTVFYPFSGPDFLNADIFYPNAEQYIMIGMEPIGYLPDLCKMSASAINNYLKTVNNSLVDIFNRSYFITSKMNNDLGKNKVNGTLPLIALFIKRTGHEIVAIQKVGIDSLGKCQVVDDYQKNLVSGIRVDFISSQDKKVRSVYYFRTDISDKGLAKNHGFNTYMSGLPQSFTYLKAASYLMHSDAFKMIRNVIFDISQTILQDDSGIAYKYFDKSKWDIKLYGKYLKPKTEFSYINEPDLQKAYKSSDVKPLPYSLGYNWGTNHCNMLYAVKNNILAKK